ncbi:MAG: hypothetical protein JEZ05_01300 [Tenericutes bacterium]|nr:hypothetical protein [Mycoplasmatota bacterium]
MKLNEFKKELKDSVQFNINNRMNEIKVASFIQDDYVQLRKPFPRKMAFSALSLVFILIIGLFINLSVKPVTSLSIDINPSIVVDLNVFNRVVSISGTNQDGLEFIEDIQYKNKRVEDVIHNIYNTGLEKEYFTESEAYMLIGVYSEDYKTEVKLGDIFNEITEVQILSIFLHSETVSESILNSVVSGAQDSVDYMTDIPTVDSSIPEGLDPGITYKAFDSSDDVTALANSYQISQTKMVLVIDVFNESDTFVTENDFQYLVDLDIASLIELYNTLE